MEQQKDIIISSPINVLPAYSEESFIAARERILLHGQSIIKFKTTLSSAVGATLSGDYSMGRISHNYFNDCRFDGASLQSAAGTGSIFKDTRFVNSNLSNSTFQSSTFEQCTFEGCNLDGCNMSDCHFQETAWNGCGRGAANMSSARLNGCTFLGTKPGNLAEAVLENTVLENIRFTNINMEFSTFQKIRTKNVVLPFSQLPYIFGGLQYLLQTDDDIRVSSHINRADSISADEYYSVLKDMEIFYTFKQEYFPLANILLAFHRWDEALAATLWGLKEAALQRDFRMCKYYCKLITSNGRFPAKTLEALYQAICQAAPVQALTEAQYHQYLKHIPEIRSMLIENPNQYPHATLRIATQIDDGDSLQTSILLSSLDRLLHLNGAALTLPSITIAHNSPEVFIISLCGMPLSILAVGALVLYAISGVCKAYNDVADAILKTQEIAKNRHDAKQWELETRKLSAEVAKLEQENPGLKKELEQTKKRIEQCGIVIVDTCFDGRDFDPMKWLKR